MDDELPNLAVVHSRALVGMEAPEVTVEVHVANGLPALSIVGLPEAAVKESKDRVRAAIANSRFEFPQRRITVNLAPADLPKEGGRFDLPIALGILAASGQIPRPPLKDIEFLGELGLSGQLRPVTGTLPAALHARRVPRTLCLPHPSAPQAALAEGAEILSAGHLLDVCAHLRGAQPLPRATAPAHDRTSREPLPDLAEVRGQQRARRALEVAAAGRHHMLMIGPPGTGKTMLASRLPGILPPMTEREAIEAAAVASVAGLDPFTAGCWRQRPFRAPHHTASAVALVGGGPHPRPGEISLAHGGVLFLDEAAEFDRRALDALREPLETGRIAIARAARRAEFPARFQLVLALNPCPQGYDCDLGEHCRCTAVQRRRHLSRLSAPLLDRIDLHVLVSRQSQAELRAAPPGEASAMVRERVEAAQALQIERQGCLNADLPASLLDRHAPLDATAAAMLEQAAQRFRLSLRACHRIQRVARTIADLSGSARIGPQHLGEAITYRALERLV